MQLKQEGILSLLFFTFLFHPRFVALYSTDSFKLAVDNIQVEGTVSHFFYIGPTSILM